jgi:acetyl-CoA acetyltransferase
MKVTDKVAAVGVGYSTTGRRTGLTSWQLAIQAAQAAMEDAGVTAADIDGITLLWGVAGPSTDDLQAVDPMDLAFMLGITPLNWFGEVSPSPAYVGAAMQGVAAIRAGFAHTVLTVRIITQRSNSQELIRDASAAPPEVVMGDRSFTASYGFDVGGMIPSIAALPARRHMDMFGTTEEHFGAHAVTQRYHAGLNEEALLREPLTIEDYLASRYIAKPVRLLDCDYPVDSASAIIYTSGDRAADCRKRPIWVEAAAYSAIRYLDFEGIDMNHNSPFHAAKELWNRTDLTRDDVDCIQVYDGFSIIVFQWLEALGFCGLGEAGPFVAEGNTRLGGRIPTNTDGGACNVGRRHGANFCIETVRQLRGECGARQVPDAEVGLWSNAVGPYSGVMLMTRD